MLEDTAAQRCVSTGQAFDPLTIASNTNAACNVATPLQCPIGQLSVSEVCLPGTFGVNINMIHYSDVNFANDLCYIKPGDIGAEVCVQWSSV